MRKNVVRVIFVFFAAFGLLGCVALTPPPEWNPIVQEKETEYEPYLKSGTGSIIGQAFLTQAGGNVVKAAGRTVTLDPATSVGVEWWNKSGKYWAHRGVTPPSPNFHKARKSAVADADGRFKLLNLPDGKYYVLTEVTWEVGGYTPTQGGLVGKLIEVQNGQATEVILSQYAQ